MHRHWCEVRGHKYECSDPACLCPCGSPLERHDYTNCPIELRPCTAHREMATTMQSAETDCPEWLQSYEKSHKQQEAERLLKQLVFYNLRLLNDDVGAPIFRENFIVQS